MVRHLIRLPSPSHIDSFTILCFLHYSVFVLLGLPSPSPPVLSLKIGNPGPWGTWATKISSICVLSEICLAWSGSASGPRRLWLIRLSAETTFPTGWEHRRHILRPSKRRVLGKEKAGIHTVLKKSWQRPSPCLSTQRTAYTYFKCVVLSDVTV